MPEFPLLKLLVNVPVTFVAPVKMVEKVMEALERDEVEAVAEVEEEDNDEVSEEYRKVFVRGRCVNFSPIVVNEFLGRSTEAVIEGEPYLHEVARVLTEKLVKKWQKKGLLPSEKLTANVTIQLDKLIFLVGTGAKLDFGNYVFEYTIKLADSFVVKLPIMFLFLLTELILQQHSDIVRADKPQGKKPLPLKFDYCLFVGTHVLDIQLSTKGEASASRSKKVTGNSKEDILAELIEISKALQDIIQASKVRKHNVDKLIRMMIEDPAAGGDEEAEEEEGTAEENEEDVSGTQ
ncbi:uncharacterized protein LOC130735203 [Lotus japonicus]|uniref:uncharacterized protein LOC130735203 n=1 Tax=Lotus japonicus TaxID=34305 RepID=UPI00258D5032|nr:uncharacterized protein LOC130735203 [Lotus japonicus]